MDQNNPYAAPQVALVDEQATRQLAGWTAGHLQLLGWLSLVSILGTLVVLVLTLFASKDMARAVQVGGLVVALLGCYLLLRLKAFAEQRFVAQGLALPIWLSLFLGLLLQGLEMYWGEAIFATLGWQTFCYFGVVALMGSATLWLGIRLLKTPNVYPVFRVMAWMEIAGGVMCASVVLMLLAILPLLGGTLCMMLVFFRGAEELRGNPTAK